MTLTSSAHGKLFLLTHQMSDSLIFGENTRKINIYFTSLYSLNLYELIKKNNYQGFSLSLIRRFCNSIVKCLRLLYHENGELNIIHYFDVKL